MPMMHEVEADSKRKQAQYHHQYIVLDHIQGEQKAMNQLTKVSEWPENYK
jgi:hypothetical protein